MKQLKALGLNSFCKTTGGKGLHVVTACSSQEGTTGLVSPKSFAHELCMQMAADNPDRYLINMTKRRGPGKIYFDYPRNDRMATAVAPLSPRARRCAGLHAIGMDADAIGLGSDALHGSHGSGPDRQKRGVAGLLRGRTPIGTGDQTIEQSQGGVDFVTCCEETEGTGRACGTAQHASDGSAAGNRAAAGTGLAVRAETGRLSMFGVSGRRRVRAQGQVGQDAFALLPRSCSDAWRPGASIICHRGITGHSSWR
jgi:hypothetical protein